MSEEKYGLRNCKRCGSLEHENDLRNDLCPNCYYDVGRFKEEREKAKADNKWLNKWQKLKEWLKNQITDLRRIEIKTKTQSLRVNDAVNCFREILYKMQELEKGEKDE